MFSIGQLSRRTGVKVPTIRFYEERGLMPTAERSAGNQRRYGQAGLERLSFIRHARDLGFSLEAITSLIALQDHPDRGCAEATEIAGAHLEEVREKLTRLRALEGELARIATSCDGSGQAQDCHILEALSDHRLCAGAH